VPCLDPWRGKSLHYPLPSRGAGSPPSRRARLLRIRIGMQDLSHDFFRKLLETPSPSGFEQPIQDVVRSWAGTYADEVRTDRHGNVIASRYPNGERYGQDGEAPRIMLAGHCDQIALMVQHIDDNGYLYVQPIGGWDMQILLGQNLTVWGRGGP